jgi:predicted HicB family RNase H-like nuclease
MSKEHNMKKKKENDNAARVEQFSFRLTKEEYSQLRIEAAKKGESMALLVHSLVKKYLNSIAK